MVVVFVTRERLCNSIQANYEGLTRGPVVGKAERRSQQACDSSTYSKRSKNNNITGLRQCENSVVATIMFGEPWTKACKVGTSSSKRAFGIPLKAPLAVQRRVPGNARPRTTEQETSYGVESM